MRILTYIAIALGLWLALSPFFEAGPVTTDLEISSPKKPLRGHVKISDLPQQWRLTGDELFVIAHDGQTLSVDLKTLADFVNRTK